MSTPAARLLHAYALVGGTPRQSPRTEVTGPNCHTHQHDKMSPHAVCGRHAASQRHTNNGLLVLPAHALLGPGSMRNQTVCSANAPPQHPAGCCMRPSTLQGAVIRSNPAGLYTRRIKEASTEPTHRLPPAPKVGSKAAAGAAAGCISRRPTSTQRTPPHTCSMQLVR